MAVIAPLLSKQAIFGAKLETTTGTPISLSASDCAFNIFDLKTTPTIENTERPGQSAWAPLPGVPGARSGTMEFRGEVVGLGSSGVPAWGLLLQAAGFAVSSQTYVPSTGSASYASLTMNHYLDGRLFQIFGAVCESLTIKGKAGQKADIDFKFKGVWSPPTSVALVTPTYPTAIPPRVATATLTVGGTALVQVGEFEIAVENKVALREDVTTASGYHSAVITEQKIMFKVGVEAQALGTRDDFAVHLLGTTAALNLVVGSSANNILTVTAPALQLNKVPELGDRDGVLLDMLEYVSVRAVAAGDDNLQAVFS